MNATKIFNKKTQRAGWLYRFTDPVTGRRTDKRVYASEKPLADKLFRKYLDLLEAGGEGWKTTYADLVSRFLREFAFGSERRKTLVTGKLERNDLDLHVAKELDDPADLTLRCKRLIEAGKHRS